MPKARSKSFTERSSALSKSVSGRTAPAAPPTVRKELTLQERLNSRDERTAARATFELLESLLANR